MADNKPKVINWENFWLMKEIGKNLQLVAGFNASVYFLEKGKVSEVFSNQYTFV